MGIFWRITLAWLLAVAMPIQGMAAVTMRLCMALPQPSTACHEQALEQAAEPTAPAAFEEAAPDHAGSCSACAACCHAVAPPSVLPLLDPVAGELPQASALIASHARVLPGGLERPPRNPPR
ncbi:hypothetical protein [Roseateles sp.]|uniref:hypothetical protein n=1 Tax=Roseateles sp. TaxID=1971397 RepID=UPI003D0CDA68